MSNELLPTSIFPRGRQLTVFAMLVSCFALWGLLNNMTDNLVPAFQRIFTMDPSRAGLVQVAFYGAYAVLALFASIIAEEFSYRVGVLAGLTIYVIGSLLYIPACVYASFDIYFVAIFAVAAGCSLLETTCNPYVLSLGDEATAVRRLNFAQAFNPVGSILGIFLAQKLILANLNPATASERAQMAPDALAAIVHNELFWVCVPYVGLCALAAIVWVFFLRINPFVSTFAQKRMGFGRVAMAGLFALVPLTTLYFLFPTMDKVLWIICGMAGPFAYVLLVKDYRSMLGILLRRPRYWCGVIAQFFYVGVQIAVWTWLNAYCQQEFGVKPDEAAFYYLVSIFLFVVMRWVATALMRRVNPALLLAAFALVGIIATAGVMYLPSTPLFTVLGHPIGWNAVALVCVTGCMSLMFPTIYGMALGGLDPRAFRLGAAGLIMSILGGAIITPWMGAIAGSESSAWFALVPGFDAVRNLDLQVSCQSIRASFVVPVVCFMVVFLYALIFSKTRVQGKCAD